MVFLIDFLKKHSRSCRSGANYIDRILASVSSGSSRMSAVGKDSTEHSFLDRRG
jgi:isocitrate lyase